MRRLAEIVVVLAAMFALVHWMDGRTNTAEDALCVLRAGQIDAQQNARQYLADVAEGKREPVPGITETDIRTSIANRERQIKALSILDCG